MLKWVGVSVEGETRVGVGNHSLVGNYMYLV